LINNKFKKVYNLSGGFKNYKNQIKWKKNINKLLNKG
jgi:predicted sulfurtransferase